MESDLDKIASGDSQWIDIIRDFYGSFSITLKQAQQDVKSRWELYKQMAAMHYGNNDENI